MSFKTGLVFFASTGTLSDEFLNAILILKAL